MESVGFADPVDVAGHSRSLARHRRRPRCRAHPGKRATGGYPDGRYYDPATGQFLSVDPVVSITGQPYPTRTRIPRMRAIQVDSALN